MATTISFLGESFPLLTICPSPGRPPAFAERIKSPIKRIPGQRRISMEAFPGALEKLRNSAACIRGEHIDFSINTELGHKSFRAIVEAFGGCNLFYLRIIKQGGFVSKRRSPKT